MDIMNKETPTLSPRRWMRGWNRYVFRMLNAVAYLIRILKAPGTFGYDHTKYRPPRDDIPMNEFGQQPVEPQDVSIVKESKPEDGRGRQSFTVRQEDDPRAAFVRPAGSPAPFAQYAVPDKEAGVPNILITRPTLDEHDPDEHGGGCCKCVIM